MKWFGKMRRHSVTGLTLDGSRLHACHVRRGKEAIEIRQAVATDLALDLSHQEVELIGREIRGHLEAAGIRERHCVAGLPAGWVMSLRTKLPELPAEDVNSFLAIEAEAGFPCDLEQLQIARSDHRSGEASYVTQLAVRKEQLERLAAVLKAAGLKPLSFTPSLLALPGVVGPAGQGAITVAVQATGATFVVATGGGVSALRTIEAITETAGGERHLSHGAVARELRITLEQVPTDLRAELGRLRLIGEETLVNQLAQTLADWARVSGLTIEVEGSPADRLAVLTAEKLGARWLETGTQPLELLPPSPGRWQRWLARYNSKRLATTGAALGAATVLAIAAFGWQEYRSWSLRSEWAAMKPQVTTLETAQARIREFRSWFDESCRELTILRRVTEAFPDTGSVTAKTFETRGPALVSVGGITRDNTALLKTLDQLRKLPEVSDLKIEQIRGKAPAHFTFNFRWNGANTR